MNDLQVNYLEHKGKYIYCLVNDKSFGFRKGKGYKILEVQENIGEYFYLLMSERPEKFPDGIAFKTTSKSFLSVEESQAKLRQLKLERVCGGTEDQTFLTD